ncbi:hypothetical protein FHS43_001825 [Streptosporangium becharense]|uniref:Uncharacterized protein n=1 Tax=Streptosporangium becharense TaxID=1816182 RepID=A0A7W9IM76_9ACTN|nr:hypothetical protein [Streptosporangium becharense]MBB2910562.1 hypothetical protein [Streptosporangium becharense]MBB5823305.1 hypothetical protein [Streptosporangium becharense]
MGEVRDVARGIVGTGVGAGDRQVDVADGTDGTDGTDGNGDDGNPEGTVVGDPGGDTTGDPAGDTVGDTVEDVRSSSETRSAAVPPPLQALTRAMTITPVVTTPARGNIH